MQVEQDLRIAADGAAVGKNLPIKLLGKRFRAFAGQITGAFHAKSEFGEGDRGYEARFAGEPPGHLLLQENLGAAETFHKAAVEDAVGAIEDHWRLRQKGKHAPRRDLGLPCRHWTR